LHQNLEILHDLQLIVVFEPLGRTLIDNIARVEDHTARSVYQTINATEQHAVKSAFSSSSLAVLSGRGRAVCCLEGGVIF
jgi:hypothetical protein